CQISFVNSGSSILCSSSFPCSSKRHTSTLLALAENNAKFTPSPSQEAPLGYGRPTRTCVPLLDVTNRAGSAGEYTCVESKSLDDSLAMQDGLSLPLCRRSNNRLIYSRTLKALQKIFHEVLAVSATVEPRREACLSPLFQTGLRGQAKSAE